MTQHHFSKDETDKLFHCWYNGEKVNDLLQKNRIEKLPNTSFVKHFPAIYCGLSCPYCYEDMFAFRSDPSHYKKTQMLYDTSTAHCLNCGHDLKKSNCRCEGCLLQKQEEAEALAKLQAERLQQRELKLQKYYEERQPINFDEMSMTGLIYLYALCYQSTCEDVSLISPLMNSESPFTPSVDWDVECLEPLLKYIFPFCKDDNILFFNDAGNIQWYGTKVFYKIKIENVDKSDFLESLLEYLKKKIRNSSVSDRYELHLLFEKLMISECIIFLKNERISYGLPHEAGEKTIALFKKLIQNWRLDQIYNIIWSRCKDAVALQVQNSLPKYRASNTIIGSIDRYVERAILNKWEIKSSYRDASNVQSILNYVMFNKILQFDGFGVEYNFEDVSTRIDGLISSEIVEDIE